MGFFLEKVLLQYIDIKACRLISPRLPTFQNGAGYETHFKASMPTVLHMLRNGERVCNDRERATYDDIFLQVEVIENE